MTGTRDYPTSARECPAGYSRALATIFNFGSADETVPDLKETRSSWIKDASFVNLLDPHNDGFGGSRRLTTDASLIQLDLVFTLEPT